MKKILFVIDSLQCAGAEKSLTTLLNLLDYSKYEVDLQLFGYGGPFENLLPKEVNLLKPLEYIEFAKLDLKKSILKAVSTKNINMLRARLKYSMEIRRKKYNTSEKARVFWTSTEKGFPVIDKEYDIAISYAQGVPTFYVADKIKAKKKFGWVNTSYRLSENERNFQRKYYQKYNNIVAVSHSANEILLNVFPEFREKLRIIYDINDYNFVKKMSLMKEKDLECITSFDGVKILTIGRLDTGKRYDRVIEASKLLNEKGINFKWYILGKGNLKSDIERDIEKYNLKEKVILLGVKENPYTYINECDIYVQTSDFEGFGLAIAEARMLNTPVVTTRFDSVFAQMVDRKNGLVVDMNSESVYKGVLELIENIELRESIIEYLKQEKKGNIEELDKFYKLIES